MDGIVLQLKFVKKLLYSLFREMENKLPQYVAVHLTPKRHMNMSAELHLRGAHLSALVIKEPWGPGQHLTAKR